MIDLQLKVDTELIPLTRFLKNFHVVELLNCFSVAINMKIKYIECQ